MARRDCPVTADVGAVMLAAVRIGLATLRRHLTDPNAKTALRAVAELTKLLSVCARHGIAVEVETEPPPVAAPVEPPPAPAAPEPPPSEPTRPPRRPTRHSLDLTATGGRPAALPPGGSPQLTSFLGAPAATGSGGDLAVTSSAGPASARGGRPSAP